MKTLITIALALFGFMSTDVRVQETPPLHPETEETGGPVSALQQLYDVQHYTLSLDVMPDERFIRGEVVMRAHALEGIQEVELDLDPRFEITRTLVNGNEATFEKRGGKLVLVGKYIDEGSSFTTTVAYKGQPHIAKRAPWDGGFVWTETPNGKHWVATAVQGNGCDLYWPCKDHVSDKADKGADMIITVPKELKAVMNGVLIDEKEEGDSKSFHWRTTKPISSYHLAINVGPFEAYELKHRNALSGDRDIPIVFYHITKDRAKLDKLIADDFIKQLEFFEKLLGPYPWGDEKIGIVEIPHLGMEHQTMNGYGNQFRLDPHGFDWLIQHEFAHEWFGNLMTQTRPRDFWLHEGFGFYMQPVYAQEILGDAGYWSYMWSRYNQIANCKPVVASETIHDSYFESADPYYKGAWTMHTLRWLMGDEKFWQAVRRALYDTADPWSLTYPITPTRRSTEDFTAIASDEHGGDVSWLVDTYLKQATLPILKSERSSDGLRLWWENTDSGDFPMPVPVKVGDKIKLVDMPGGQGFLKLLDDQAYQIDPGTKVLRDFGTGAACPVN